MEFTLNDTWISVVNAAMELLNKPHLSQLSDSGEIAASVRLHLPNAIETISSRYRWSCLASTADLNRIVENDRKLLNRFRLPIDVACIDKIHSKGCQWKRQGDYIITASDTCILEYTRMPETPQDLDALLRSAVENLLASLCALKLTGSSEMQSTYYTLYENLIQLQIEKEKELVQPFGGHLYWHEEAKLF